MPPAEPPGVPPMPVRPAWQLLLAAAGVFALTMGIRNTMGVYLSPLQSGTGLPVASISLAFAAGQLCWGLSQPIAGAIADRVGTGRVVCVGIVLLVIGTLITPWMTSTAGLVVSIGVLAAGGAGMAGPSVLMAAGARLVRPGQRGLATGFVNAGGSLGQLVMAPAAIALTATQGWALSLQYLGLLALLGLPAIAVLKGHNAGTAGTAQTAPPGAADTLPLRQALARALATPSYRFLALGFMVCGFHVAFLATHLPGVVEHCGMPPAVAGGALALLGLFNIVGSLAIGWAIGRWRMKSLLAGIYMARGGAVVLFLLAPKTPSVMLVFAAVMGMTFLSTVPPTAGLVARMFGPSNLAMLFGLLMLAHQVGGFLGAWLGGQALQRTGSYDAVWYLDVTLAAVAALLHLPIRESAAQPSPA